VGTGCKVASRSTTNTASRVATCAMLTGACWTPGCHSASSPTTCVAQHPNAHASHQLLLAPAAHPKARSLRRCRVPPVGPHLQPALRGGSVHGGDGGGGALQPVHQHDAARRELHARQLRVALETRAAAAVR
jgi:hypothetical protein